MLNPHILWNRSTLQKNNKRIDTSIKNINFIVSLWLIMRVTKKPKATRLIIPMTVIMMRQGYDYWQNKVLLAIIDQLQPYIREADMVDMFGIQEDIIFSIRYKDMGIRKADYAKFRARLSTLSLIPVAIPSWLNNESYHRYHRLGTVFFEEGDSKEFMIQLDKEVLHHIISKNYGFCELTKEVFLTCKNRYSQQIYLMLASWREEGHHTANVKYLENQLALDQKPKDGEKREDLFTILENTKKELDDLLASGCGDLSFDYEKEGEQGESLYIKIKC